MWIRRALDLLPRAALDLPPAWNFAWEQIELSARSARLIHVDCRLNYNMYQYIK